jgi:hypothetical protein
MQLCGGLLPLILQRAAMFLEWAWDVRRGCSRQRAGARKAQGQAWKKTVDEDVRW